MKTIKPIKKNIRIWVEALRSGKYRKGRRSLKTPKGFCCLGVACDLYRKETGRGMWDAYGNFVLGKTSIDRFYLPRAVQLWLGMPDYSPSTKEGNLTIMNDNGKSFKQIATAIKKQWLK